MKMLSSVSTVMLLISAMVVISCASPFPICYFLRCFGRSCCILPTATTTTINSCGENMHHDDCGTSCPAYCGSPMNVICDKKCNSGCFCDEGFVLDKPNGICVPTEDCPKTEDA